MKQRATNQDHVCGMFAVVGSSMKNENHLRKMSRRLTSQALSREEEDTVIKDALLDGIDVEGCEVA